MGRQGDQSLNAAPKHHAHKCAQSRGEEGVRPLPSSTLGLLCSKKDVPGSHAMLSNSAWCGGQIAVTHVARCAEWSPTALQAAGSKAEMNLESCT